MKNYSNLLTFAILCSATGTAFADTSVSANPECKVEMRDISAAEVKDKLKLTLAFDGTSVKFVGKLAPDVLDKLVVMDKKVKKPVELDLHNKIEKSDDIKNHAINVGVSLKYCADSKGQTFDEFLLNNDCKVEKDMVDVSLKSRFKIPAIESTDLAIAAIIDSNATTSFSLPKDSLVYSDEFKTRKDILDQANCSTCFLTRDARAAELLVLTSMSDLYSPEMIKVLLVQDKKHLSELIAKSKNSAELEDVVSKILEDSKWVEKVGSKNKDFLSLQLIIKDLYSSAIHKAGEFADASGNVKSVRESLALTVYLSDQIESLSVSAKDKIALREQFTNIYSSLTDKIQDSFEESKSRHTSYKLSDLMAEVLSTSKTVLSESALAQAAADGLTVEEFQKPKSSKNAPDHITARARYAAKGDENQLVDYSSQQCMGQSQVDCRDAQAILTQFRTTYAVVLGTVSKPTAPVAPSIPAQNQMYDPYAFYFPTATQTQRTPDGKPHSPWYYAGLQEPQMSGVIPLNPNTSTQAMVPQNGYGFNPNQVNSTTDNQSFLNALNTNQKPISST